MTPLRSLLPGMLAGAVAVAPLSAQDADPVTRVPMIRTEASARRDVRADLAYVSFSFTAAGATPLEAGRNVAAKADSIRGALQRLGIPRDSLLSGSRWYWWRGRVETVLGPARYIPAPNPRDGGRNVQDTTYLAYDAIQVGTRDMAKVGPIIDAVLSFGVTQIDPIRFQAVNTAAIEDTLLRDATLGARRNAVIMADASGEQLVRLLELTTSPDRFQSEPYLVAMSARGSSSGGTEVTAPFVPLSVTVYGRWEVKAR